MKRCIAFLTAVVLIFALTGCGGGYFAIGFVQSNSPKSYYMSFMQLEGTVSVDLKYENGEVLEYSGKLEKGSITVYYDCDGTTSELFKISGGESVETVRVSLPDIQKKGKVYIDIVTDGKCENGSFSFKIVSK